MTEQTVETLKPHPAFANIDEWVKEVLEKPDSFFMSDPEGKFFTGPHFWSIGPCIRTGSSSFIEDANACSLIKELESDPTLADEWQIVSCSHWAIGWVDHLAFQVLKPYAPGEAKSLYDVPSHPGYHLSRMALFVKEWFDRLSDYPVADDVELAQLEYDATLEAIRDQAKGLRENLPEEWEKQIFNVLFRMDGSPIHLEGHDASIDDKRLEEALKILGFKDLQEEDECK